MSSLSFLYLLHSLVAHVFILINMIVQLRLRYLRRTVKQMLCKVKISKCLLSELCVCVWICHLLIHTFKILDVGKI